MKTKTRGHLTLIYVCGDIGEEQEEIEFVPMPATEPIREPSPQIVPAPEKVPA